MEEIRNFRMRAYASDEPFTLTLCAQEQDDWQTKDIAKIYLYDASFYEKVISAINRKIVDKYCGAPMETVVLEHKIKRGEKLIVTILDHKFVQPHNPDYEVDISVSVLHEYNNGSEVLTNINIKSLYNCGCHIAEIVSKFRKDSRARVWSD